MKSLGDKATPPEGCLALPAAVDRVAGVGKSLQPGTWCVWLSWGFGQSFLGSGSLLSGEEGHSHYCSSAPA